MRITRIALLAAAATLAVGIGGCGGGKADKSGSGGTAVFSNVAETPTLDPAVAFSSDGFVFVRNVYEGLLEYAPGTLDLRPLLATKWTESDGGLTYTFTLREGVEFHDGSPFDAAAAKLSIERVQKINQGPATLASNIASVAAPSPTELVIKLKRKDVYFLGALPKLPIVSAKAVRDHPGKDKWARDWFATHAAGTGPYELVDWRRNSAINLKRNESYWREFPDGAPAKVRLRTDPDVQTALQLLGQGQIDMMGAVGPDDSAAAKKMSGVKLVEQPSLQVQVVPMNVTKGPLKDPRVRRAIALAFDYGALVDFYKGYAERSTGPLPGEFGKAIAARKPIERNIAEAKRLLAQAGHPGGGFTLTFLGLKGLAYEEFTATLLEDNLKQLGIKLKSQIVPWPQMVEVQSKPSTAAELSFLNMSPMTDDPSYMLRSSYASESLASKGGYNWSYVEDRKLDAAIDRLPTIHDDAARETAVGELNEEIAGRDLALYVTQPKLAQPVRSDWDVKYEPVDASYTVRFFYAKKR